MTRNHSFFVLGAAVFISSCAVFIDDKADKTVDGFIDSKDLSELRAGIWIDPNGCDHWIIDDGVEGYLSQRLSRDGKPVCSGLPLANTVIGDFKGGSFINSPL
ncbi:MAG: hypothetical protein ACC631_11375 [Halocynthiibacter sp.]